MVNQQDRLTRLYGAIADPTRRAMLERLRTGPRTVTDLGAPFDITLAAVGKHVTVLEGAGLVRTAKRGRVRTCAMIPDGLGDAQEWIQRQTAFWNSRLDSLDAHLRAES